jgi:hypothetical protein
MLSTGTYGISSDKELDTKLQEQYLPHWIPNKSESGKLAEGSFLELFDGRTINIVNNFIMNEASKERRGKFHKIFNKIARQTERKRLYVADQLFDRSFHIANIYGNGLLSIDGINRVAKWISTCSKEDEQIFKDIMGALKSVQSYARPISHTHNEYNPPPVHKKDILLAKSVNSLAEEAIYRRYMQLQAKEALKKKKEEMKRLREKEEKIMFQTGYNKRPATANGKVSRKDFDQKKPYGLFSTQSYLKSTTKEHFCLPNTRLTSTGEQIFEPTNIKNEKMSFLPKAIITTASFGVVAPSTDVSFLNFASRNEKTGKRKKRYYTKLTMSEQLANAPQVSKDLSDTLNKTTYNTHYCRPSSVPSVPIRQKQQFKAPYGDFPTLPEYGLTTEYVSKYNEKSLRRN